MKKFKLILRIIVTIILIVPSLPCLYMTFTIFGIGLIIPVAGIIGYVINFLVDGNQDDNKEMIQIGGYMLVAPFIFWHTFIVGKNPIEMIK